MSESFTWERADRNSVQCKVNRRLFRSVADFKQSTSSVVYNVVFVTLPSLPLFRKALHILSDMTQADTLVLVDDRMGILYEELVRRYLTNVTCMGVFWKYGVRATPPSVFQCDADLMPQVHVGSIVSSANVSMTRPGTDLHPHLCTLSELIVNEAALQTQPKLRGHLDAFTVNVWSDYITTVCLDLVSFTLNQPVPGRLLRGKSTRFVVRNILNELVSLVEVVSGAPYADYFCHAEGDVLRSRLVDQWRRSRTSEFTDSTLAISSCPNIGGFTLILLFQMILIADGHSQQCVGLEFLYALLVRRIIPSYTTEASYDLGVWYWEIDGCFRAHKQLDDGALPEADGVLMNNGHQSRQWVYEDEDRPLAPVSRHAFRARRSCRFADEMYNVDMDSDIFEIKEPWSTQAGSHYAEIGQRSQPLTAPNTTRPIWHKKKKLWNPFEGLRQLSGDFNSDDGSVKRKSLQWTKLFLENLHEDGLRWNTTDRYHELQRPPDV